jgi:hypothetical protein
MLMSAGFFLNMAVGAFIATVMARFLTKDRR